jgi:hypothetical protein
MFSLKIPLPGVLQGVFAALVGRLTDYEKVAIEAAEAAYPGAGAVVKAALDKYQGPVERALDAVAIASKAAVELGDAIKTLHAFAKPDPTDGS